MIEALSILVPSFLPVSIPSLTPFKTSFPVDTTPDTTDDTALILKQLLIFSYLFLLELSQ